MKRILFVLPLLVSLTAVGQNINPSNVKVNADYRGWIYDAGITIGGNITRNEYVLSGAQNGDTFTLTSNALVNLNYAKRNYEWRNSLALGLGFSQTPSLPELVKGDDYIKVVSEFRYKLAGINWIFPYVDASWTSNMLDAVDRRASVANYTVDGAAFSANELALSSGLSIHRFEETAGVILALFNKSSVPELNLEGRIGIGARQNAFNGQKIVESVDVDVEPDAVNVVTKEYSSKVGIKYGLYAKGLLGNKMVSYTAYAEALSPFSQFPAEVNGRELTMGEATDHALGLNVAFSPLSWLSLVYDFKNVRQPEIQAQSQVTHSFLATTAFAMKGTL